MRAEIRDTYGDLSVLFRELTLGEIRQWVATVAANAAAESDKSGSNGVVDTLLFDEFSTSDIVLLTDLTDDDLANMAPSEIDAIYQRCKVVNARFFAMRDRLSEIGRAAMDQAIPAQFS